MCGLLENACKLTIPFLSLSQPSPPKCPFYRVSHFYRVQQPAYWEDVFYYNKQAGIPNPHPTMFAYAYTNAGHIAAPANRYLSGLFFGAELFFNNGGYAPPTQSYFGTERYSFVINFMLTPGQHNLYFSDVYCTPKPSHHRITLVITKVGSIQDLFCAGNLVKLRLEDNPFFRVHFNPIEGIHEYYYRRFPRRCATIEFFYADHVPMSWSNKRDFVQSKIGNSLNRGIPRPQAKMDACGVCNGHGISGPDGEVVDESSSQPGTPGSTAPPPLISRPSSHLSGSSVATAFPYNSTSPLLPPTYSNADRPPMMLPTPSPPPSQIPPRPILLPLTQFGSNDGKGLQGNRGGAGRKRKRMASHENWIPRPKRPLLSKPTRNRYLE